VTVETEVIAPPLSPSPAPITLFQRIWRGAGLSIALIATVVWSGFLAYMLFLLVF
jgi:hypothetical protein